MLRHTGYTRTYRHGHLCCGIGAGARGFNMSNPRVGRLSARFECAGGIDVDAGAIVNFERMTGVKGTVMDLFDRDQYRAFHGKEPPQGWREATPEDIRAVFGRLDVMFASMPCKGFSALLSQATSLTAKYQALNSLTLRAMFLFLEAYRDDPAKIILFENVPRIATRGRWLLDQIVALLRCYGYETNEDNHDCGEVGDLAQSRKRFLLVARHPKLVPPYVYLPPKHRLRGVGEVIGKLPLPGEARGGPMHRVPALQWKTWVRLAFVPAGRDWRALNELAVEDGRLRDYGILPERELREGALGVLRWEGNAPCLTTARAPAQGRFSIADPRAGPWNTDVLGVRAWGTKTGAICSRSGPTNGAFSDADPRPGYSDGTHTNLLCIAAFNMHAKTVSGASHVAGGALSVADPRYAARDRASTLGVKTWEQASGVVAGESHPSNGAFSVADPRPGYRDAHKNVLRVVPMTRAAGAITGQGRPSCGAGAVADPRVAGHFSSAPLGVGDWMQTGPIAAGNMSGGSGPDAIADPRVTGRPRFNNTFRIVPFAAASPAVAGPGGTAGGLCVADPRAPTGRHTNGKYRVTAFGMSSNAVIGASTTGMGAFVVADPRISSYGEHANKLRVVAEFTAAPTVTGSDRVGSGALSVADPRPLCLTHPDRTAYLTQGHYGVVGWKDTSGAVPAFAKNNNGPWSVAEPRDLELDEEFAGLPQPDDRLVARIIALDGTWHRPFTTLELAALQSLFDPEEIFGDITDDPEHPSDHERLHRRQANGRPDALGFDLIGRSDAMKREWIGNAVPSKAAKAMADTIGETLLRAEQGETFQLSSQEIWVKPLALALAVNPNQPAILLDA